MDRSDLVGASHPHAHGLGLGSDRGSPHEGLADAEVQHDVVRRSVRPALPDSVMDGLPAGVRRIDHRVGDVRGEMVGTGDDADLVPLGPRVPEHARLLESPCGVGLLAVSDAARRVLVLVVLPSALVDLRHHVDLGVVVAPVCAHGIGAGSVGDRDPAGPPGDFVHELGLVAHAAAKSHRAEGQQFPVRAVGKQEARMGRDEERHDRIVAMRVDQVAVAERVARISLVAVQR